MRNFVSLRTIETALALCRFCAFGGCTAAESATAGDRSPIIGGEQGPQAWARYGLDFNSVLTELEVSGVNNIAIFAFLDTS